MSTAKVNYSLNKRYFVDEQVFVKLIKVAIKESKVAKLKDCNVTISSEKETFEAFINVDIKKGVTYKEALLKIKDLIEDYSKNIIDTKPKNVAISIEGEY